MGLIQDTIGKIDQLNYQLMDQTQKRLDNLTKPLGSLGRLEELVKQLVGITNNPEPTLKNRVIITMAGDHGVAEEKISAYPAEVTPQMVYNFLRGGAAINVLARQANARVVFVDMGVKHDFKNTDGLVHKKIGYGTKNFIKEAAMIRDEAIKSIEAGIQIVEEEISKGIDIIGTGDMGIGNTTSSSAIIAAVTHEEVAKITGSGTGIDNAIWLNKVKVIKKALEVNQPDSQDPVDVLAKVGGFEIGGIAGVILAGAAHRIPVIIDGFISGAAALIATRIEPKCKDFLIAAHCSMEQGHRITLQYMGLEPLLDLRMRLGEGTGTALAMHLAESALCLLKEMASFDQAGVSKKSEDISEMNQKASSINKEVVK